MIIFAIMEKNSKEILEIRGFLGLDLKIEIKDITVFIGAQSTGKSVLMKLLYYFRTFCGFLDPDNEEFFFQKEAELPLLSFAEKSDWAAELFYKYFPEKYLRNNDFEIHYRQGDFAVSLIKKDGKLEVEFSEEFLEKYDKEVTNYLNWMSETYKEHFPMPLQLHYKVEGLIRKRFHFPELVYIPSERAFFSVFYNNIYNLLKSPNITPFFRNFISAAGDATSLLTPPYYKGTKEYDELAEKIIKGKIGKNPQNNQIIVKDSRRKRETPLHLTASGIQTAVPAILVLKWFLLRGRNFPSLVYFEEPETHLFPDSQYDLIKLLAMFHNETGSRIVISTHSPYVLNALNLLLEAGNLRKDFPDVKELKDYEKTALSSGRFSAYFLTEEGNAENIFDEETELTDDYYLEKNIVETFDKEEERLLQIRKKYEKQ